MDGTGGSKRSNIWAGEDGRLLCWSGDRSVSYHPGIHTHQDILNDFVDPSRTAWWFDLRSVRKKSSCVYKWHAIVPVCEAAFSLMVKGAHHITPRFDSRPEGVYRMSYSLYVSCLYLCILIRCSEEQRLYSELPLDVWAPHPISKAEPSHPTKEAHFGRLYPRSHSSGHYPKLMTIGEVWT